MKPQRRNVGIDIDINGGMTDTAKIIRDAWVLPANNPSEKNALCRDRSIEGKTVRCSCK